MHDWLQPPEQRSLGTKSNRRTSWITRVTLLNIHPTDHASFTSLHAEELHVHGRVWLRWNANNGWPLPTTLRELQRRDWQWQNSALSQLSAALQFPLCPSAGTGTHHLQSSQNHTAQETQSRLLSYQLYPVYEKKRRVTTHAKGEKEDWTVCQSPLPLKSSMTLSMHVTGERSEPITKQAPPSMTKPRNLTCCIT